MALTVSTDLTSITDAETAGASGWSDIGGGSGSLQETDFSIQGSECRSRAVSGAAASRGMIYDNGANLDFSSSGAHKDKLIYFWIATFAPGLVDPLSAAPGLRIRIDCGVTAGTDWAEWDIMYSDLIPSEGTEFFKVYVLDPRAPPTRTNGTFTLTTLRHFGAVLDTNATAKGQNLAIDRISYGFGEIRCYGTSNDETSGLEELVDWDWGTKGNRYGILTKDEAGNVSCKGKIVIGDSAGTNATDFKAQDTVIRWSPTWYYDGTRVRPTVGYDFNNKWTGRKSTGATYYGVELVGNGTGDTNVTLGALVGTDNGRSGPTFLGGLILPVRFVGDDGSVEGLFCYGTTFENLRLIDLSANSSSDVLYGCTFRACGTLKLGSVVGRNNNFVSGLGGSYKVLERFINRAATGAEALATADPVLDWVNVVNGTDWSVPSAATKYVELLGGTARTNVTVFGYDAVGSDDHYAECIISFPSAGAGQGVLGPVIAGHATNQDYFWLKVDLLNDQVTLIYTASGSDTPIAGPTSFTMDEDEDYICRIRRSGTTIEAFVAGVSAADGLHLVKLSATNSNLTGSTQRRVGLRGDAAAGQTGSTGQRPRVRLFGVGPISDDRGSLLIPSVANFDFDGANFINCARALHFGTAGSNFPLTHVNLDGNLIDALNSTGSSVTVNISNGDTPTTQELYGSSTFTFSNPVTFTLTNLVAGSEVRLYVGGTSTELDGVESSGTSFAYAYNYTGDQDIDYVVHNVAYNWIRLRETLTNQDRAVKVNQVADRNYSNP